MARARKWKNRIDSGERFGYNKTYAQDRTFSVGYDSLFRTTWAEEAFFMP
jgi:hypothetical protein